MADINCGGTEFTYYFCEKCGDRVVVVVGPIPTIPDRIGTFGACMECSRLVLITADTSWQEPGDDTPTFNPRLTGRA